MWLWKLFLQLTTEIGTGGKHFSKTEEDANRPIGYFWANVVVWILSKWYHQLVGPLNETLFKGLKFICVHMSVRSWPMSLYQSKATPTVVHMHLPLQTNKLT